MKKGSKGEQMKVRCSRKAYFLVYLMVLILILIIAFIKITGLPLNKWALLVGGIFILGCLIGVEIHRWNNVYEITSKALIHTKGILRKNSRTVDFSAISDMDAVQDLWQRILNYGNVHVHLYSRDSATFVRDIGNPKKFIDFLHNKMRESPQDEKGMGKEK